MEQLIVSKDDNYYTPKYVVDYFYPFGFDYDPATTKEKAEEFKCLYYDTIKTNGLIKDWTQYKTIWINPPFTLKYDFLKKAVDTYKKVHNTIYILLPIEFLITSKFHSLDCKYKLYIPKRRINFESGLGKKGKSPAFGSIILKLSNENSIEYFDFSLN